VARPEVLDSPRAENERRKAADFFSDPARDRQTRFNFSIYKSPQVRDTLIELFYGKCAYCESEARASQPVDTEHYRPKGSVAESPEHPGYWWLASDWSNMLISCADCSRSRTQAGERAGKANRFPLVDEADRAFGPGGESRERPLLLDPCRDDPEAHLVFDEMGHVVSETQRGQTSISMLGLNRSGLVDARKRAAAVVLAAVRNIDDLLGTTGISGRTDALQRDLAALRELTAAHQEYAALKRQLVRPVIDRLIAEGLVDPASGLAASTPKITKSHKDRAKASFREYQGRPVELLAGGREGPRDVSIGAPAHRAGTNPQC
jgi:uncharacterized protein (TIGR02646 family)